MDTFVTAMFKLIFLYLMVVIAAPLMADHVDAIIALVGLQFLLHAVSFERIEGDGDDDEDDGDES